jgi:hypothetical protein
MSLPHWDDRQDIGRGEDEKERHVLSWNISALRHIISPARVEVIYFNPCTLSACYREKLDLLALDLVAFEGC